MATKLKILVPVEIEMSLGPEGLPVIASVKTPDHNYISKFVELMDYDRMKSLCGMAGYSQQEFVKIGDHYILNNDPEIWRD